MHAVRLSPFFLSKYELTQGQWLRFTGENPSRDTPQAYAINWNRERRPGSLLHPVEQVSWDECRLLLGRIGLELPSEAQWEYAARGGTGTPWWTGRTKESLAGAANLLDAYANENGGEATPSPELWLDDGHSVHAPVGSFRANPFGLHDVIGNVWEWCLDKPGNYAGVEPMSLDPVLEPWETDLRESRGGSHESPAYQASSAMRTPLSPSAKVPGIGLRPCRRVEFAER